MECCQLLPAMNSIRKEMKPGITIYYLFYTNMKCQTTGSMSVYVKMR